MVTQAELDPQAILDTLGYGEGVLGITPVTGGADTAIWRVERPEGCYALRVFRAAQARDCAREAAVLGADLPGVPRPHLYATGVWRDRPAMLIGWCPGVMLFEAFLAAPQRLPALAAEFGRVQARLHAAPVPEALAAQSRHWVDWQGSGGGPLGTHLRAITSRRRSVLHFDYHPLNVLVEGEEISAVIDWTNVQVGDRRADFARTLTILRLSPAPEGLPLAAFHAALRVMEQHWRRGYREVGGTLRGLAPFYAWAGVAMINDLSPRLGRGVTEEQLAKVGAWVEYWRVRIVPRPPAAAGTLP